ncbi:hypothetical protein BCR43DRAFT_488219 [Syncephalastrum racemosum]|uniref:CUE domain-containing protein n=1 Tax=Syncephalastrum racemosum TaxID=13706 RepID=A0A1X2HJP2_SYNRA|nr:hypothetical protein BCR43DRAFT_488219 [Syncephalastrum racemosum]
MDSAGPSGFRNAPVSKLLVQIVGGCSAAVALLDIRTHLPIYGRWASHPWAFPSFAPAVAGTMLIYRMRVIERRFGSAKYAAFIFVSIVISTLAQTGLLYFLGDRWFLSSGPYALVFAMLYQYYRIVPVITRFPVMGISLSDKIYAYMLAGQLIMSRSLLSAIPCLCGVAVGALYDVNFLGLRQWRFPSVLRRLGSNYLLPLLSSPSPPLAPGSPSTRATPRRVSPSSSRQGLRHRRPPPPPSTPVSEENITMVASMFPNYSRDAISRALANAHNDMNRAAEILLNTPPSN